MENIANRKAKWGNRFTATNAEDIVGGPPIDYTVPAGSGGFHIFFSKVIRPATKNTFVSPVITGSQIC